MTPATSNPQNVNALFDLTGKVAIVTGATGHLGSAIASALAESGANVIATSRRISDAQASAAALPIVHDTQKHHGICLDHMDEASINKGFDQCVAVGAKVDILINNGHEALVSDWTNVSADEFTRQLANVTGETLTEAIRASVEERYERLRRVNS